MNTKTKNMDRSRTRSPPNHKGRETSKVLQQNSYKSRNNRTIQGICQRSKVLANNQKYSLQKKSDQAT